MHEIEIRFLSASFKSDADRIIREKRIYKIANKGGFILKKSCSPIRPVRFPPMPDGGLRPLADYR
jgi:hypothetical protein